MVEASQLLVIGKRLASARFRGYLEKDDLRVANEVLATLVGTKKGVKNLNRAMRSIDEAIALAGYLQTKCRSLHFETDKALKRLYATLSESVRKDLLKTGKATRDAVDSAVLCKDAYAKAEKELGRTQELLGYMESLRSAAYRRHDTLLEISRTERVLLRET